MPGRTVPGTPCPVRLHFYPLSRVPVFASYFIIKIDSIGRFKILERTASVSIVGSVSP